MLKASLKFHDPIVLYDFLYQNIGPLNILIRDDYAIIKFLSESHHYLAAQKYHSFSLCDKKIDLFPYHEEKNNLIMENSEKEVRNVDKVELESMPQKEIFPFAQGLQIKDRNDVIEKIVKEYKMSMVEHIVTYDNFLKQAQQKIKKQAQNNQSNQKIQRIKKFIEKRLKTIKKTLINGFISLNSDLKEFDEQKPKQINLELGLECSEVVEKPLHFKNFKDHVQYLNKDISSIKRISPLNKSQFITSTICNIYEAGKIERDEGRLKIYDVNKQSQTEWMTCKEGSSGLLVLGQYIITGTDQNYFAFFHQERTNIQELTPRMFKDYQHKISITDILKCGRRQNGHNILALGKSAQGDSIVKSFYVNEVEMFPNIRSLIFEENQKTLIEMKAINSIEVIQQKERFLIGCKNQIRSIDLNKSIVEREFNVQSQIFRIKKINNNSVFLAQKKNISFVDLRSFGIKKYTFKTDVTAVCPLNNESVIYGTDKGEIGLYDIRQQRTIQSNTFLHKQSMIEDIIKHNDLVISGDSGGQIISWKGL